MGGNVPAPANFKNAVPGLYNFDPAMLPRWRSALAKMRRGQRNARLALIGDSTTRGTNKTITANLQNQTGYPVQLAALLNAAGIPAGWGNLFGSGSSIDAVPATDGRVALSGAMSQSVGSSTTSFGGYLFGSNGSGTLSFTPTAAFDTIDLYYVRNSGFTAINVNVDGGASLGTAVANGSAALVKQSFTCALGVHTVNVAGGTGQTYIVGIDTYNSASKQISCLNCGWPGATAANLAENNLVWKTLPGLSTLAPDLSIIDDGINDWVTGVSVVTYTNSVQALITAAKAQGDVILKTPVPSANSQIPIATQANYVAALKQLAVSNNIPLIDVWSRIGSYEIGQPLGFYSDNLHPTDVGYSEVASAVFNTLRLA